MTTVFRAHGMKRASRLGMDAIDLLKEQHQEVKQLFSQIEQADADEEKQNLFDELADKLAAHATIEEKIFYPAAYAKKTKELLTEAVEEHLAMKRIIADLMNMEMDDENFDAKIKVLKEQVLHHVQEEEGALFAAARKELSAKDIKRFGDAMQELFDEEISGSPREEIPSQTDEAAPLKHQGSYGAQSR